MTNALSTIQDNLPMWEDKAKLQEIRKLFAPKLTDLEFQFFVGLGKAAGLNPFTREIWSVKYADNAPAQVFIGRDGYRKAAQSHSEYDYHQADAVYENDEFEVTNGEVRHKYKLTNRGALVGAYCIAKRHKSSRPMYVFAELKEYSTGKSLWNMQTGKPATMIKKVAESQCLRACFQDLLGGTYGEEEMERTKPLQVIDTETGEVLSRTEQLKRDIKKRSGETYETYNAQNVEVIEDNDSKVQKRNKRNNASGIDHPSSNQEVQDDNSSDFQESGNDPIDLTPATDDQIDLISSLLSESNDPERREKAFRYFGITELKELNITQAKRFIELLSKT